ncbi:MAG: hypothetical protein RIF33_14695 [Cyclobacteriaceae bacterium]
MKTQRMYLEHFNITVNDLKKLFAFFRQPSHTSRYEVVAMT